MGENKQNKIIVGISGASGAVLGIRTLQLLGKLEIQTHLIISEAARETIISETGWSIDAVMSLADKNYPPTAIASAIASGSFHTDGMMIVPCSIKTLSALANAYTDNLMVRAADVCLKEGRPLLLAVRETPLHPGHIRLMGLAAKSGAIIFPPVPSFYAGQQTVEKMIDNTVGRMLQRIGIKNDFYHTWRGEE